MYSSHLCIHDTDQHSHTHTHTVLYIEKSFNLIVNCESVHIIFISLKKKNQKKCGPTVSDGLPTDAHSQVRSRYCATRRLLPAVFPPWAGSSLLRQPGSPGLPPVTHIDAGLSADTRSTWHACWQGPRPQTVPISSLQVAGLQEHATTPSG